MDPMTAGRYRLDVIYKEPPYRVPESHARWDDSVPAKIRRCRPNPPRDSARDQKVISARTTSRLTARRGRPHVGSDSARTTRLGWIRRDLATAPLSRSFSGVQLAMRDPNAALNHWRSARLARHLVNELVRVSLRRRSEPRDREYVELEPKCPTRRPASAQTDYCWNPSPRKDSGIADDRLEEPRPN